MVGDGDEMSSKESPDETEPVSEEKETGSEQATGSLVSKEIDPSCYKYEGDRCFYVDPSSGAEYEWNQEKKEWDPRRADSNTALTSKDYKFDGDTYYYTDDKSKTTYKWDKTKNEWVKQPENGSGEAKTTESSENKEEFFSDGEEFDEGETKPEFKRQDMSKGVYGFDGDSHTYTDTKDGTVYIWDREKNAWFPKVDDDFLAQYQMNYGFTTEEPEITPEPKKEEKKEVKPDQPSDNLKRKQDPTWFDVDEKNNTKVYVSNLPLDLTEKEFIDLMQKCGLVMKELNSSKFKIKMYTDPETKSFKGDALCTYIKVESVNLALSILDGYEFKGQKISVERAKFQMKGESYDPNLKPKKKSKKQIEKIKKMQQKLFDWRPDKLRGEREKNERVVVIKNLFDPAQFDKDVSLILEYQQDLREEASKCGDLKKVVIFDRHPEGVAQIMFKEAEAADACILLFNNRWFGKRQIKAETWDGKTKYTVAETEEQKTERLKKWTKHLEEEEEKDKKKRAESQQGDVDTQSSAGSGDETDEEDAKTKEKSGDDQNQTSNTNS